MNEKESEEKQLLRHLQDLAALSERKNGPVATNFLGLAEQSLFYGHRALFAPYPYTVTGGYPDAERRIILFGVPEAEATEADAGTGTDSFLSLIRIDRKSTRFTSPPSHRDYLGALLSLGIRRELLGDILPDENGSGVCVFCTAGIAPYLCENLESVRNDRVSCSLITALPPQYACKTRPESLSVASPRLDAIIAAVWHLSRDESHALFPAGRIFVNGRCITDGSEKPQPDAILSVRGLGRIRYLGQSGETRKGRSWITVLRYL